MGPRELVILLLGLALVAVVLRGLHVALTARRGQIKLAIDKNIPKDIDLETLESSEFPNGGARVVARSLQQVNRQNQAAVTQPKNSPSGLLQNSSIPVLMDNVEMRRQEIPTDSLDAALGDDLYDDSVELDSFSFGSEIADDETKAIVDDDTRANDLISETATEDFDEERNVQEESVVETTQNKDSTSLPEVAIEFDDLDVIDEDWLQETVISESTAPDYAGVAETDEAAITDDGRDSKDSQDSVADSFMFVDDESTSVADSEPDRATAEADENSADEITEIEQAALNDQPDVYRHNLQHQDSEQRREPVLSIDDEFSDFSMTAGERIGVDKPLADQVDLFDAAQDDEMPASISAGGRRKKSFFANLAKKVRPEKDTSSYGPSGEYEVFPEDVYEQDDGFDPLLDGQLESLDNYSADAADKGSVLTQGDVGTLEEEAYTDLLDEIAQDSMSGNRLEQTEDMLEETVSDLAQQGGKNSALNIELAEPEDLQTAPVVANEKVTAMAPRPEPKPEPAPTIDEPSEVVVLNVMSREGREFHGNDLLQVLITSGLKFGEMNIFHKRVDNSNHGPVLFSVANIINPGIFDLNAMEDFRTRGITLFLTLPSAINNLEALDLMLDTAQQIRGALDGELRDDTRNVMTAQTIEHYRQRVRDFELSLLKTGSRH